jgi:mono/diheme cytochrome c family protein
MKLFRFLAYFLAFIIGAVFAFNGTNSFPGKPAKQYQPTYAVKKTSVIDDVKGPILSEQAQLGKTLFAVNCAACHNRNMKDDMTGPALGGAEERWSTFPQEDLYNWIRNSQAMISQEHPRALALWEASNRLIMTSFPNLSDQEVEAILTYVEAVIQP